jgi:hypothetical protein
MTATTARKKKAAKTRTRETATESSGDALDPEGNVVQFREI